jgi:molecular chaperone DnaK
MAAAVGIDLGTTNTVVSVVKDGFPVTLVDSEKRRLLPSVVSFHPSGKVLVGDAAKERRIVDPESTIFSVKRLIGRGWESPEVQRARKTMPFELVEGEGHEVQVTARGERYTLPEISAFVLRRAKAIAEISLNEPIRQAVITVPANFNDPQREGTKLAGKLAGLEVLRILNEPTAAALAYGESSGQQERVAVYDLGGGTFDVTLLDVRGTVFQVLATGGDTSLGGDDIDELVARLMGESLLRQFRFDARTDPTARATLKARAEELKIVLSSNASADVALNSLVRGDGGHFVPASFKLDRKVLETLSTPILDRTLETCRATLTKVGMKVGDVERILLVGGSTRMPLVGRRVEEYFGRKVSARVNPDEVVAHGAAIQAAALAKGADVGKGSIRPRPSFSFALGAGFIAGPPKPSDAPGHTSDAPPAVVVPRAPNLPTVDLDTTPAVPAVVKRPSALPPRASAPLMPRVPVTLVGPGPAKKPSAPPAALVGAAPVGSTHVGIGAVGPKPSLSTDQEAILKAFLGGSAPAPAVEKPAAPAPPRPPTKPPISDIEAELRAFVAGDLPGKPAPVATKSKDDIESELRAFLSAEAGPPGSEAIVGVVDQPEPPISIPPIEFPPSSVPVSAPFVEAELTPPSRPLLPHLIAPSPVISELDDIPDLIIPTKRGSSAPPLEAKAGPPPLPQIAQADVALPHKKPPPLPVPRRATPLLVDVTPLSLGVETVGGFCDVVIRANSPVPCDRTRAFRTASDNQTSVVLKVCQGESDKFAENTPLGDLRLTGFRAAGRGEVEISVTFEIDADGILNVQAREGSTGRSAVARIELLGAQNDAKKIQAMMDRQALREVV